VTLAGDGTVVKLDSAQLKDRSIDASGYDKLGLSFAESQWCLLFFCL
jgi:hypothetical protein